MTGKARGAEERLEGNEGPKGDRFLTVRLPEEAYWFLIEEGVELALARGEDPEAVAAERKEVERKVEARQSRKRGLIVFGDVVTNAVAVLQSYGDLPRPIQARLEQDRAALANKTGQRISKFFYLQHVLFARSEAVASKGPGFDAVPDARRSTR